MGRTSLKSADSDLPANILGQPVPIRPIDTAWKTIADLPSVVPVCERCQTVEEVRLALREYHRQKKAAYKIVFSRDSGSALPNKGKHKEPSKYRVQPPGHQLKLDVCAEWHLRPADVEPLKWQGMTARKFRISADQVRTFWKIIGREVTDAYSSAIRANTRFHEDGV